MSRITSLLLTSAATAAIALGGASEASAHANAKLAFKLSSPVAHTAKAKSARKTSRHNNKPARPIAKPAAAPAAPAAAAAAPVAGPAMSDLDNQIRDCANTERAKVGLPALVEDPALDRAAHNHATDMATNDYFDHTSQNGATPWDRIKAALDGETPFRTMGENIAAGFDDATSTCTGWMNSPGHKANILNPNYKDIGTAWINGYAVQDFGAR